MTDKDEKMVEAFFHACRNDVLPDGGFTRRVVDSLPHRNVRALGLWTWTCYAAVVAFFFMADGAGAVKAIAGNLAGGLTDIFWQLTSTRSALMSTAASVATLLFIGLSWLVSNVRQAL